MALFPDQLFGGQRIDSPAGPALVEADGCSQLADRQRPGATQLREDPALGERRSSAAGCDPALLAEIQASHFAKRFVTGHGLLRSLRTASNIVAKRNDRVTVQRAATVAMRNDCKLQP